MIRRQIPNCITLSNLLCGCLSIYFSIGEVNLVLAGAFILLGAFLDFFDGMAARLLKAQGPIGKELDSLADVVTFGVAPGFIAFCLISQSQAPYLAYSAFLIPLLSAYRLAKFNIDERQTTSFIGLPTPANVVWASIAFISSGFYFSFPLGECFSTGIRTLFSYSWILTGLAVFLSILLVSNIPLFSLKFKTLSIKENKIQFLFLTLSLLLVLLMNTIAIPFIVLLYILLSFAKRK